MDPFLCTEHAEVNFEDNLYLCPLVTLDQSTHTHPVPLTKPTERREDINDIIDHSLDQFNNFINNRVNHNSAPSPSYQPASPVHDTLYTVDRTGDLNCTATTSSSTLNFTELLDPAHESATHNILASQLEDIVANTIILAPITPPATPTSEFELYFVSTNPILSSPSPTNCH